MPEITVGKDPIYAELETEIERYVVPTVKNASNQAFTSLFTAMGEGKATIERVEPIFSKAMRIKGQWEIKVKELEMSYNTELNNMFALNEEVAKGKNAEMRLAIALKESKTLSALKTNLDNAKLEFLWAENFNARVRLKYEMLIKGHDTNSRQITILDQMIQLGQLLPDHIVKGFNDGSQNKQNRIKVDLGEPTSATDNVTKPTSDLEDDF